MLVLVGLRDSLLLTGLTSARPKAENERFCTVYLTQMIQRLLSCMAKEHVAVLLRGLLQQFP